jgi:hypothetical protein
MESFGVTVVVMGRRWKWLLFIGLLLLSAIGFSRLSLPKGGSTVLSHRNGCHNPTEFKDTTTARDQVLSVCEESIFLGDLLVVDKHQAPEIFEHSMGRPEIEAASYEIDEVEYVAIFPVVNAMTWYARGGYVFKREQDTLVKVFGKDISQLNGRWTGVRFLENGSLTEYETLVINQDVVMLGAMGFQVRWSDYYEWQPEQQAYALANNKQSYRLSELMEEYERWDTEGCLLTSGIEASLSSLYQTRRGQERFCDDNAEVPYITNDQATKFLKAKKALELNLEGENISFDDIEEMLL